MTHPLQWFLDRIGKKVVCDLTNGQIVAEPIKDETFARHFHGYCQNRGFTFRDPHPLTASILTCAVISCDECGKVGTTEQLDTEQAAREFEGDGLEKIK